ncbi:MAG: DUF1501 domain-containing protein [Planctomycetota bacterium]|jgi:hypothetical protein
MLSICDNSVGMNRRKMLTVSGLTLGGLALSGSSRSQAADASASSVLTGKSIIFIFQQGGPSQFETFDPKPNAPQDIRTIGRCIQTALPSVLFGETMQQTARLADKLTIVRSFQTGNAEHNIRPIVGPESLGANVGAIYSRVAGSTHPETSMPTNAVIHPQAVSSEAVRGAGRGDFLATGPFGSPFAPFVPGGASQLLNNLRLNLSPSRFQDRRTLLTEFDRMRSEFEEDATFSSFDRNQRQACDAIMSGRVAEALDLSREDPRLVARYDTSRFNAPDNWASANRGRRGYYTGHAKAFGKSLLLARRLCEAGCGFVTVHSDYEGVWDMHADGENLNMADGMNAVGRSFDHGIAAFIADVEARGLSDKILLIATGEMGRTPRINRNGGRDHWAKLAPLLLYGGGMTGGRVIGQSTRDGGEPASDEYTSANLVSTILHTAFDTGKLRLLPAFGSISRLAESRPIPMA